MEEPLGMAEPIQSETSHGANALPLAGMRVVEWADKLETCGRLLADLGADVVLIEPPEDAAARRREPLLDGESLYFATHHANKRSVCLDFATGEGRQRLRDLLAHAHLFIETTGPGVLASIGLSVADLRRDFPRLVILSISDFGQTGPYRDHQATDAVLLAMSGALCRSGLPGQTPLLPPRALASETAAMSAAYCALLAYWEALHSGSGDHLDFSIFEAVCQLLDPVLGVTGSAAAGKTAAELTTRDRPTPYPLYPTFRCADGYVRLCVLAPRQWEAMFDWLGRPPEFGDPSYAKLATRLAQGASINALIARQFASQPASDLVAEGQRRGVPIARVASASDVLADPHFQARGAFTTTEVAGRPAMVPSGFLEVDGKRLGYRRRAPRLGEHGDAVWAEWSAAAALDGSGGAAPRRPLQGLKVLDLGIIVAGAECGRVLSDQGAEVVKVEYSAFPDGSRQSLTGAPMSPAFAQGSRGKRSVGVNLKSEAGKAVFRRMAAQADVVLSNFKPGTLDSLELGHDVLKAINPGIVMMDSSALGRTGPQSRSLGYGPLVRASAGLSGLWRYPALEGSFSDGITIYPDHVAARVSAVGVLALLIRRCRTGVGGTVSVSQAETFLMAMSHELLRESLQPGSLVARGNDDEFSAPDGVFPCAGEDEWCVVSVRDDADWQRLCRAIGQPALADDPAFARASGRVARRSEVDRLIAHWTRQHSPREVTRQLQKAGVPAGFMLRLNEFNQDPHLIARGYFRRLTQPGLSHGQLLTENSPCKAERMPEPDIRPAPYQAEHTREVVASWLGLPDSEIEALIQAGNLEDRSSSA